ncbi:MAG: RNA polymerase sigma factor [Pseudomonadota bacterium]
MEASDEVLVERIARRDMKALEAFYARHETALYNFLRAKLNDHALAYDVVNEAMFEVWQNAGRFEGRSRPRSWLFTIARNRAVDRLRKGKRDVALEPDFDMADENAVHAEDVIAAAQDADRLAHCLGRIPEAQREVVHLAFFEDMSLVQISEVIGTPEGTVKSRMFHAKRALRHCLESLVRRA